MFLGFRTLRKGLKPPTKKTFACPFNEKTKRWNSVWTFGSALYKFQRIWSEKKEFDTNGLITCRYRYRGYIPVCFKKSLPTFPWCTLKISCLFSWPGLKGRILILNDLKSRIRIKSFRIHALAFNRELYGMFTAVPWRVAGSVTSSTVSLSSPEEPGPFLMSANPQFLGLISLSPIWKLLRCANPWIKNPQVQQNTAQLCLKTNLKVIFVNLKARKSEKLYKSANLRNFFAIAQTVLKVIFVNLKGRKSNKLLFPQICGFSFRVWCLTRWSATILLSLPSCFLA
jgi:hypothetical protein